MAKRKAPSVEPTYYSESEDEQFDEESEEDEEYETFATRYLAVEEAEEDDLAAAKGDEGWTRWLLSFFHERDLCLLYAIAMSGASHHLPHMRLAPSMMLMTISFLAYYILTNVPIERSKIRVSHWFVAAFIVAVPLWLTAVFHQSWGHLQLRHFQFIWLWSTYPIFRLLMRREELQLIVTGFCWLMLLGTITTPLAIALAPLHSAAVIIAGFFTLVGAQTVIVGRSMAIGRCCRKRL